MKRSLMSLLGLTLALAACAGEAGGIATTATSGASTTTSSTAATTTTAAAEDESTTTSTTTTRATTTTTGATTTTTGATTTTTGAATTTTGATTTTAAVTTTAAPVAGSTVTIAAENFSFSPSTVTIRVGDTIQWVLSEGSHTTTSGVAPTPDGRWNQVITADAPVSITFDQAGQFRFYCRFHVDSMQGTVVVEP